MEKKYIFLFVTFLVGCPLSYSIFEGENVLNGAPFMAFVRPYPGHPNNVVECGGTILNSTSILTAAHCIKRGNGLYVSIAPTICRDFVNETFVAPENIIIHPQYNKSSLEYDVAVINLPSALKFGKTLYPINLPSKESFEVDFKKISYIYGCGAENSLDLENSEYIKRAPLRIVNNSECSELYGDIMFNSMICAKGFNQTNGNVCSMDSGGPLLTLDSMGQPNQIGVISFTKLDGCDDNVPSGFTQISAVLDFIHGR